MLGKIAVDKLKKRPDLRVSEGPVDLAGDSGRDRADEQRGRDSDLVETRALSSSGGIKDPSAKCIQ